MGKSKPIGLTKNTGYQVGARKTVPLKPEEAWEFLLTEDIMEIWLGLTQEPKLSSDMEFETMGGITGRITTFNEPSNIRMKWKEKNWNNFSTLQIKLIPKNQKTIISFHQENLQDQNQREQMKNKWSDVLNELKAAAKNQNMSSI